MAKGTPQLLALRILICQRHGDLRLAGYGSNSLAGRLEIYYEEQWGAVCGSTKFNTLTASVACRQLGLGPAIDVVYYPDLRFGIGELESKINDVICVGTESHILQCHTSISKCLRYQHVGIICSRILLPYSGAIRIIDSQSYSSSGYLELFLNGQWRSICDDGFNQLAAASSCRQLGYTTGTYQKRSLLSGTKAWKISSSCEDNDVCLSTCGNLNGSSVDSSTCTHRVNLNCVFNDTSLNTLFGNQSICELFGLQAHYGNIKINSSVTLGVQGVPEIYIDGSWRKVCSHASFTIMDADVICKQLSFTFAVRYRLVSGSPSTGALVSCSGLEHSVTDCFRLNTSQCSDFIELKCNNEEPVYGSLKLVDGSGSSGSLYVFNGNQFQPVCDTGFGLNELNVACRQLGYERGLQIINNSLYTVGSYLNTSFDYSFSCAGYEKYLLGCQRVHNRLCRYPYDTVAVQCGVSEPQMIRLVNGPTRNSGRLEVSIGNVWGTVCGLQFNHFAAHVACRELGFETVGTYTMTRETVASPSIILTSVLCSGFESNLQSCLHSVSDNGTCRHINDLYLNCSLEYPILDGSLRIIPSINSSNSSGRLEIAYHGIWMSVCGKFFTKEAADVSCRQMGFSHAQSYCTKACNITGGSEYVFFAEAHCNGNELQLIECEYELHNMKLCSQESYVGITCVQRETPTPTVLQTIYPSPTVTEGTAGGVSPSPSSDFFLPISETMFYFLAGSIGAITVLICILCVVAICCCLCCRRKRTYWETHSVNVATVNGTRGQDNIYDSPQFDYLYDTKDSCVSWEPYSEGGEDETDLKHPPHYDEINFRSLSPSCNGNYYEGLSSTAALEHNGSSEKMLHSCNF